MKRNRMISVFACCLILPACKTSNFRGSATTADNPVVETEKITTTVPTVTTTTTTANPPVVTATTVDTSTTELALNQTCEKPVQLLMTQTKFTFEKQDKCDFGAGDNATQAEGKLTARKIQTKPLKLPENSEICSMTLESPMTQMKYDDFMILTIDNFVLFSSNKNLVMPQGQINGFYTWDFLKVRGMTLDFNAAPYCVGAADRCKFPVTDTLGAIQMKLNYSEIAGIAKGIQGKVEVPVALIATGDNDDGTTDFGGVKDKFDCYHEAFDLTVSLNYIKKPKP